MTAGCGPLRFTLQLHDVSLSAARQDAITDAVEEFGVLVGRTVEQVTPADAESPTAAENAPGDPIVIEMAWSDEQPSALGFAEPHVVGSTYDGGWVLLNPIIRNAPTGVIRRLVLHELGHLHGLADVDDATEIMDPSLSASQWGAGDLVGLMVTHGGSCPGATLGAELGAVVG